MNILNKVATYFANKIAKPKVIKAMVKAGYHIDEKKAKKKVIVNIVKNLTTNDGNFEDILGNYDLETHAINLVINKESLRVLYHELTHSLQSNLRLEYECYLKDYYERSTEIEARVIPAFIQYPNADIKDIEEHYTNQFRKKLIGT